MMTSNPSADTLMEWLEEHRDQSILIHKLEQADSDHVRIRLSGVEYKPETESIDGYTNESALRLLGQGTVFNGGQSLPLPYDSFIIPVSGLTLMESVDNRMILKTDNAEYTLYVD
jgi:hypothetical protein